MGFNIVRKEVVPNPKEFLNSIQSLKQELSNDEILMLLNNSWRPSKVGAWIIGLCRIEELEKDLIQYLKNRPIYCEHIIINLPLFNTPTGNQALRNYAQSQMERILILTRRGKEHEAGEMFERNSILWAFNAIRYLDSINSTKHYNELINSVVSN